MDPLIRRIAITDVGVLEVAAASAMLHSFYTEIEKVFKLIAQEVDTRTPSSESWHRELLNQMAAAGLDRTTRHDH